MARKPKVRYFASRKAYYCQLNGTQHKLATGPDDFPEGPTYTSALSRFLELTDMSEAGNRGATNTVRVILDLYGQHLEGNGQGKSLEILLETMPTALESFGDTRVIDLRPFHVQGWLDARKTWGPTYRRMALRTLVAALNWGVNKGYMRAQPITSKNVTVKGGKPGKGEEAYLPPDKWQKILEACGKNVWFGDLLRFMLATGCRPGEAYNVQARYYDEKHKRFILPGHPGEDDYCWKMARKTGRDRVIYVPDELVEMVEDRVAKHPKGPIFRTRKNGAWHQQTVSVNLIAYAKKAKVSPNPTAYSARHSFATDWLLASGNVKVLADLIGSSVQMIERTYAHLHADAPKVRSILAATLAGRSGSRAVVAADPSSPSFAARVSSEKKVKKS